MVAAQQQLAARQLSQPVQVLRCLLKAHRPGDIAADDNGVVCLYCFQPMLTDFFFMTAPVLAKNFHWLGGRFA